MSNTQLSPFLSPVEARQIDQTCDRFEAAWKAGRRPRPEEYLGTDTGPARSALLRQLLLLDWDYRRRAGDDPRADDYHTRFPGDTAVIRDVGREMSGAGDSTPVGATGLPLPDALRSGESASESAGEVTGSARYDLLQEVGCGGIGVVFRGRDRVLGRNLAVKVLREAFRDRPDARRRFLDEARIGSRLQHPAIVPVYEMGSFDDGRPYFTMKLVEGHTLAALLRGRTDTSQDLSRWLGVFEQVCQAVAYAHSQGVIHRDLKPANVMVGAFGEVQVMDWGFAKSGDRGQETGDREDAASGVTHGLPDDTVDGAIMGTPAYMPPEQARGQATLIDARADVFALGAILCEILTGRPPYVGVGDDEVYLQAAAADLDSAEARLDSCGADVELRELTKQCLAAERHGRPQDAGVVARRVTTYLASSQDRLRKAQVERAAAEARAQAERRTRRLTVALAAAAVLLVLGAAAAPAVGFVLLRAEQKRTEGERQAAVAAREDEARRRQQTRQALDLLAGPVIEDWLAKQVAVTPQQKRFLDRALAIYAEFAAETADDEASRAGLANAYYRVGVIHVILGRKPEAEEALTRAAELFTRLTAETPGRLEYRSKLADTLHNRINIWRETGRREQAETAMRDLVVLRRQLAADSSEPEHRAALARALIDLGQFSIARGQLPDAETLAREALTLLDERAGGDSNRAELAHARAKALSGLGRVLEDMGRSADAERAQRDTLELLLQLVAGNPGDLEYRRNLGFAYDSLGIKMRHRNRLREAEAAHREALKVRQPLVAAFPAHAPFRADVAASHHELGFVLALQDQHDDAEQSYRRALAIYEKLAAESPVELAPRFGQALAHNGLGLLLRTVNRPDEAGAAERESERLFRELAAADPGVPDYRHYLAGCLLNRALAHHRRGEQDAARRLLDEALPHHRAAVRDGPHVTEYRFFLCTNRFGLAQTFLAENQHTGAAAAAGQLAEAAADARLPDQLVKAAVVLACCAALAEQDAELAGSYAERVVTTLRLAVTHGYRDAAALRKHAAFAPVLSRSDFQELLAELEKARKKP